MLHVQEPVTGWLECLPALPAGLHVKAFAVQWLAEAKSQNPGIKTLLRYTNDGLQQVSASDTDAIRTARARDWFNRFIDDTFLNGQTNGIPHWQATDLVSWWNEYYADSQSPAEKELWWRQERIAAQVWRDEYRNGPHVDKLGHIRLSICATAVGNDIPLQSAETAVQYDCVLDYHAYTHWTRSNNRVSQPMTTLDMLRPASRTYSMNMASGMAKRPIAAMKFMEGMPIRSEGDWRFLSGRWAFMDATFRAAGYFCDWIFGESGPFESAVTGWRSPECLNGVVNDYVMAVSTWLTDVRGTQAFSAGRVLGFALFTTVGGNQWQGFQTRQPELNALATMVANEWVGPLPPPPGSDWQQEVWLESIQRQTISLNPHAALQSAIFADGFTPVETEFRFTPSDGIRRACQAAEHVGDGRRRVYYAVVPQWNDVHWFSV